MSEARILQQASRIFAEKLPPGWKQKMTLPKGGNRSNGIFEITGSDGTKARVFTMAKSRLYKP